MLRYFVPFILCLYCTTKLTVQENIDDSELLKSFLQQNVESNSQKRPVHYQFAKLNNQTNTRVKRETRIVTFLVNGKQIQFSLKPTEYNVLTKSVPVWTAEYIREDLLEIKRNTYRYIYPDGTIYENFNKKAVMYASRKNGRMNYYGVYKEDNQMKIIQTLPEKLHFNQLTNFSDYIISDSSMTLEVSVVLPQDDEKYVPSIWKTHKTRERSDILYPKLLIIVDYNYYLKFGGSINEILQYISVFWNSVQLKYREMTHPKIEIMINGIIVAKDSNSLDKILIKDSKDSTKIDLHKFFDKGFDFIKWFGKSEKFQNFDNVIVMTNYTGILNGHECSGCASFGGICAKNVTFVHDNVNFDGIITATHELGHTIGMSDDTTTHTEGFGTIMYQYHNPADSFYWTKRNSEHVKEFASVWQSWCLDKSVRDQ